MHNPVAAENLVIMGRFASVYGVRGWLKVNSYSDPIDNLLTYPNWQVHHQGQWQTLHIESGKIHGNMLVVKISGCDDRELARTYTNDTIAIPREQLPELDENEFYWHDLIGLQVTTTNGVVLGTVDSLIETGANDVLVVTGDTRRLIPYVDHVVIQVDKAQGTITVDWDPDY